MSKLPLWLEVDLKEAGFDPTQFEFDSDWLYNAPEPCSEAASGLHDDKECDECLLKKLPVKPLLPARNMPPQSASLLGLE